MRIIFWAGFAAFITDQLTKYIVVHAMELSRVRSIDVFPPLLNFRYSENRGINFGLFGDGADRWGPCQCGRSPDLWLCARFSEHYLLRHQ